AEVNSADSLSCAAKMSMSRVFFFSSRRRHTRSKRDWSSDVCSSDLYQPYNLTIKLRRNLILPISAKTEKNIDRSSFTVGLFRQWSASLPFYSKNIKEHFQHG